MFNIIDGELRKYLEEITERDVTPEGADEYLSHEHYHSFLKGCDCEIVLKNIKRNGNFPNETVMVNKYCKTHKVMCSKTGWEVGWYGGTKTNSRKNIKPRILSESQEEEINKIYNKSRNKETIKDLAKTYKVSTTTIIKRLKRD